MKLSNGLWCGPLADQLSRVQPDRLFRRQCLAPALTTIRLSRVRAWRSTALPTAQSVTTFSIAGTLQAAGVQPFEGMILGFGIPISTGLPEHRGQGNVAFSSSSAAVSETYKAAPNPVDRFRSTTSILSCVCMPATLFDPQQSRRPRPRSAKALLTKNKPHALGVD